MQKGAKNRGVLPGPKRRGRAEQVLPVLRHAVSPGTESGGTEGKRPVSEMENGNGSAAKNSRKSTSRAAADWQAVENEKPMAEGGLK
jgi:hypothetical protein